MSLTQLFGVLRAARWSILLMMLVAASVAFLFARTLPKEYTAKARVLLDIGNSDPMQFTSVRKESIDSYLATAIRLVGDTGVANIVVDQLGWPQNPAVIDAWQSQTGGKVELRSWASSRLMANMGASQLQDGSVIEIFYSAGDPEAAKQIVGLIRSAYIANSQRLRVDAAGRAAKWNRTQAARARAELIKAQQARIDFADANKLILDPKGLTTEMDALDASIQAVTQPPTKLIAPRLGPSATMIYVQQQLNSVEAALSFVAGRGPSNPDYLMLLSRQQSLRAQLARATQDAQRDTGTLATATQEMRAKADRDYLTARLAVLQQSATYDHLLDLDRAVAMKQRLYDAAVYRADQFDQVAASPSTMKIVGDVIGDDEPSFPDVPVMTALAAGFGLLLGISVTLMSEMLGHRIRSSEDLAMSSTVPVLAVIESGSPVLRLLRWRWPWRLRQGTLQPAE